MDSLPEYSWAHLHEAEYDFYHSFNIRLTDGRQLLIDHIISLSPHKRITGLARWNNKTVFVKLFFHLKDAGKHFHADIAGINILQQHQISTPTIVMRSVSDDRKIFVLLLEFIPNAKTLQEMWFQRISVEDILPTITSVITTVADQHNLGIFQKDLNIRNHLIAANKIYSIDGGHIEYYDRPISKEMSLKRLAKFFSYLHNDIASYVEQLFITYCQRRDGSVNPEDIEVLLVLIKKQNRRRWFSYKKMIYSDSRDFMQIKTPEIRGMIQRNYFLALKGMLMNPRKFLHASGNFFNSKKINRHKMHLQLGRHHFIVTRFNQKWYECFFKSKASTYWLAKHKKSFFFKRESLNPIAYIEKIKPSLGRKSYYITDYQ